MLKEGTEEDYYKEAGDFIYGSFQKSCVFTSKTPVLFLPSELHTKNRSQYYKAIITAVEAGNLNAVYCFAKHPTMKNLHHLFDPNEKTRTAFREHLARVKELVELNLIDLRVSETTGFISGLVADKIGMIHHKPPLSLVTEKVDFVTGSDLRIHNERFKSFSKKLSRVNDNVFMDLIIGARESHVKSILIPLVEQFGKEVMGHFKRTDSVTDTITNLLKLPSLPGVTDIKAAFKHYAEELPPSERDEYLEKFVIPFLDKFSFLRDSVDTFRKTSDEYGKKGWLSSVLEYDKVDSFIPKETLKAKAPVKNYKIITEKRTKLSGAEFVNKLRTNRDKGKFLIWIDDPRNEIYINNKKARLSPSPKRFLILLLENAEEIVKYKRIFKELMAKKSDIEKKADDVRYFDKTDREIILRCVSDMRKQLHIQDIYDLKEHIEPVPGTGYMFIKKKGDKFCVIQSQED